MKKNKRGGKRSNAGRKKVSDPKVQLTIYIERSKIERAGGMEQAKKIAYAAAQLEGISEFIGNHKYVYFIEDKDTQKWAYIEEIIDFSKMQTTADKPDHRHEWRFTSNPLQAKSFPNKKAAQDGIENYYPAFDEELKKRLIVTEHEFVFKSNLQLTI